jgi:RND superfamily putative drug exporter
LTRIARLAVRRPLPVIAAWLLVVAVLALIGRGVEHRLQPTQLRVGGTETHRWGELREGHFGEGLAVLLTGPKKELDRQGPALARALLERDNTRAVSPWSGGEAARHLRPSPEEALIVLDVDIAEGQSRSTFIPPLERFVDARVSAPVEAHLSGLAPLGRDINDATVDSLHKGELLAFPVLLVVLLLVFRSPLAAAVPLIVALGTLEAGAGIISLVTGFASLDAIALNLASMIGLALGVDYSLLLVTRFREALAESRSPSDAAWIAANTAGRTALFAGAVLIAIMLIALVLSPGTVLLSAAVGSIVVTLLSMLGAALVTPAAVRLLGHRVDLWRLGGPRGATPRPESGRIARIVRSSSRRPARTVALTLGALLVLAAPVLALQTIPPDPRQLPASSKGLQDFNAVRKAGFGPEVDIVLEAPKGALTDPARLRQIQEFEDRLRRLPAVKFAVGPGEIGARTRPLGTAPQEIRQGERRLARGEKDLNRLARGLGRATHGVGQLRDGLSDAANGASRLEQGTGRAADGTDELAAGAKRAADGARRIANGSKRAYSGSRDLTKGATRARRGAKSIAAGNGRLSDQLNGRLAPGAQQLAQGLRDGQGKLTQLRAPAQTTERELNNALGALNAMTAGKVDPQYAAALRAVATALGAASGRNPVTGAAVAPGYQGLDASIAYAASEAGRGADGADQLAGGAREAADGAKRLRDGAGELQTGLVRLEQGSRRLESGLERLMNGAEPLAGGLGGFSTGANRLKNGLAELLDGQSRLAGGLQSGLTRSQPLEARLSEGAGEVASVRDQLANRTGRFEQLRNVERLDRESPGFFRSGYATVAALEGARPLERETALTFVDSSTGGSVGHITVIPDLPTNDPRTAAFVDRIREETRAFAARTGMTAAVGGAAGELVDYDRATSARIPLLVILICLVTYLLLVPVMRSLVLPAVAVGLNMLTVGVGFGILTLLFVGDNPPLGGAGALDVISVAGIFAITFALSIDYQVFLLTRMREEYVRTRDHEAAIAFGIQKTARVVTGAAAIMVAVFAAFALSDFVTVKQFGVGLATAILVDATIVRLALLPALLRLLGRRTWWIPRRLDRRLPALDVEGARYAHSPPAPRLRVSEA